MKLFWSFLEIGLFGFGGGQAMIPLIQEEVVELNGWLTREEFLEFFALGNTLPGPISTNMAASVGYKIADPLGATVSLIGLTAPTILAMVLLLTAYLRFRDVRAIAGFLRGARPVVIAPLALVVWQFAPSA
ncbi:MAG TPA: chromate transporter [Trueperaceae bacterium]